jgi:hypothetical protein
MSFDNPLDPLSHLDSVKTDKWYSPYIKPAIMLVAFTVFSYFTLWMGQHYVTNEKFGDYVKAQIDSDKRQDERAEQRFAVTQTKLETIINQQVSYSEQLKAYNQIMVSIQKQVDSIDNRVIYLERYHADRGDRAPITPAK